MLLGLSDPQAFADEKKQTLEFSKELRMAMHEFHGSHVINIDDYAKENTIDTPLIHKIKRTGICDEVKEDYEPNIFSIGPYHNRKLATKKDMQTMKYECLDSILKMNEDNKLEDYMKAIKGMENQIRNCYGDEIEMDRNSFLKMLLLDGCFIILTLHGAEEISPPMPGITNEGIKMKVYVNKGETIIDMEALENIQTTEENAVNELDLFSSDILLLENQIPFFVITKIYEIATGGNNNTSLLIESVAKFIEETIRFSPKSITAFDRPKKFHHLLHLCHMYFKPSIGSNDMYQSRDREPIRWHRATTYSKAGICFKKKEFHIENPHSLLDIAFSDGVTEIPCLEIDHNTRCLFRNLIAFERTCPQYGNYVTSYVVFWSQIIRLPEDVTLLTKRGIIVHQLNSDAEIVDLFVKLSEGIVFDINDSCYLKSTCCKMESHYERNKSRLIAWSDSITSKVHKAFSVVSRVL